MNKMYTITKLYLKVEEHQITMLPVKARILNVKLVKGSICLWILADNDLPSLESGIWMFKTGAEIFNAGILEYIDTIGYNELSNVLHVFVDRS